MGLDMKSLALKVRVTDGAWGTELQSRGLPSGAPPELWNAENPSAVESVARGYVQAGSDVIITNTFGANRFVLGSHGAAARAAELAEAGARISLEAAGRKRMMDSETGPPKSPPGALVFGSIGPTGKIVMMGDVPESDIAAAFAESAEAIARAGVDAILLESFAELAEIALALNAAKSVTDLPVVCSMTFASGPDGTATMMGTTPEDLVKMAESNGAAAVGGNCGTGPQNFVKVARSLRAATGLPIWIKPNAGLPTIVDGKTVFPMGPEEFASFVPALVEAGANFVGGCCGTTPAHIRAIRAAVDKR